MNRRIKILFFAMALLLASTFVFGGYEKTKTNKLKTKDDLYSQVEIFGDAISVIKSEYVDEVDSKKLIYGALKGMMESLDDFSQFMEPEEYNEIKVATKGEFGGIGVEISTRDGILTIVTPIVGTPAEGAGVKPGDKIVKIDGKITKNMKLSDSIKLLRGKPGTTVTLTVWREKPGKILEIPIKRDIIKIHSIKKADFIEDKIGYIKIIEFQENTIRDLEESLKRLEKEGMDSLILDLRNNPGGLLDAAVDLSERFLAKDKVIVSIKSRTPEPSAVFKSSGRYVHPNYPLIVMVNEGSASASEIVAGAIQDNKRGIILGTKTFGKASVQAVIPLRDASALKITTASYFTPANKMIKGQGIIPDVVVENQEPKVGKEEPVDVFEKLDGNIPPPSKDTSQKTKDNELEAAVNLMKAIKIYKSGEPDR